MKYLALVTACLALACNSTEGNREAPRESTVEPSASAPTLQSASIPADHELTLVADSSQVCMVNNQFMGRAQIPVEVGGKTYFGCCEMCKKRLSSDASARTSKDPVTGKVVDKATAVIAKRSSGDVLYFENSETFERYRAM